MKHYVYRIDNLINGKYYIGKHSAKSLDNSYMGSGKLIIKAIDKWGIENFKKTILKTFPNSKEAFDYEAEIVTQELVDDPMCYNIMKGGRGGSEKKFTDEEIKKHESDRRHNYEQRPERVEYYREHRREYEQRPEVKERRRKNRRNYYQRKKQSAQINQLHECSLLE